MYANLTPSAEDYMKAIYATTLENRVVRIKDIAKRLQVKMPSVVNAIKSLSRKNFLVHESYGYIELTPLGLEVGKEIYERHLVLYRFLKDVLQIDENIASQDACAIEHYLNPETMDRIVKLLDFMQISPDSEPGWLKKFRVFLKTGKRECTHRVKTLDKLDMGKTAVVKNINLDSSVKKRLMDMGLIKGEKIKITKKAPLGDPINITVKNYDLSLRREDAQNIEVEEEK